MINKYNFLKIRDGFIKYNNREYYVSSFNPDWLKILNIEPNVFFDVGASSGGDSLRFNRFYPNCLIYAFEASPEIFKNLKTIDDIKNINIYNKAISNKNGYVDFYEIISKKDNKAKCGSLLKTSPDYNKINSNLFQKEAIKIESVRIDSFCLENNIKTVDFMHADVEGALKEVLLSLGKIKPKILNLEMNNNLENKFIGYNKNEIHVHLIEKGYNLIYEGNHDNVYLLNDF